MLGGAFGIENPGGAYECTGNGGSGSFVSEDRADVTLTFSGCGGGGITFTTPGQPKGTIETEPLRAKLVYLDAAQEAVFQRP